jgi:LPXTG-motif cell wall-anchored protein
MRHRIRRCATAVGIALALALPAAAGASPRTQQYSNPISNETPPASASNGGVEAKTTGSLPFTGQELGGAVLVGLALLTAGGVLLVRTRRND